MSDHWVTVIPQDPWFIPTIQAQQQAAEYFSQIVDDPNCVEVIVHEGVELHDCGCNLAGILCPSCDEFIDEEWWDAWTGEDYDDDRKTHTLTPRQLPCCGESYSLQQLIYDFDQGFATFALEAENPNVGELSLEQKATFEQLLSCPIKVIYSHL
jgi:hypothetical protein